MALIKNTQSDRTVQLSCVNPGSMPPSPREGFILCPACGGENPEDAVFCGNHQCHKALGEFKYVLEELQATKSWIQRLADKVSDFIAKPHFIVFHMVWFTAWILANEGFFGQIPNFDEYPYSLLGIILAIEAVLITGFLLISQSRQNAYSDKRAELDYEVNIRSYRKIIELEKRLDSLLANGLDPIGKE